VSACDLLNLFEQVGLRAEEGIPHGDAEEGETAPHAVRT
jgi:hypothetical protein